MLELSVASGFAKTDIMVPTSKLLFEVVASTGTITSLDNALIADDDDNHATVVAKDLILEMLQATGSVEVQKFDVFGNPTTLIPTTSISEIAQIAAQNEGLIFVGKEVIAGVTKYVMRFTVELSNVGAVEASKGEFLKVTVREYTGKLLPTTDNAVTATLNVYSFGAPKKTNAVITYKQAGTQANTDTTIYTEGAYSVAFPISKLVDIEFLYPDGHQWKIEKSECQLIATDLEEFVASLNGRMINTLDYIVVPCDTATRFKIKTSADANVYLISNVAI